MTMRDRILSVYRGETPDVVPYMLDLSHWFYQKNHRPWDLSQEYEKPEYELINYHKKAAVGFYIANLASFYSVNYGNDVSVNVQKIVRNGIPEVTWRYTTPIGSISRTRIWEEETYSWAIREWGVKTEQDLKVLGYVLSTRTFSPRWDIYQAWVDYVGDLGVVYMPAGYSAMGYLLSLWMGIERTMYAVYDWPEIMHQVVDQINGNNLLCIDMLTTSSADVIIMGDNFSSEIQPPHFFKEWSYPFYAEAVRHLHNVGKYVAVHIDGKLRGALAMIRDTGADCGDAITPTPLGDLTPEQCREEAGPNFILSGGVSPDLWLPTTSTKDFKNAVIKWLNLRKYGPQLIANAGDQVPPGAVEDRIEIMRDLVAKHGKY